MKRGGQMQRTPLPPRAEPMRRGKPLTSKPRISGASQAGFSGGAGTPPVASRKPVRETGPSRKVRELVLERDGYACVCCGNSIIGHPYSLQHRKRRSQGGDSSPANLITVLGDGTTGCHARIDSRSDPHDEARGYTVRSWDDPALIPVMVFSPGGSGVLAWPTPDGRWALGDPAVTP